MHHVMWVAREFKVDRNVYMSKMFYKQAGQKLYIFHLPHT